MKTSTSEVIAVVIAQPTFICQDVFILTSIRTLELTTTILSLKRQVRWVLQPVKITSEITEHLILYIGVRLLTTLPLSGGLGYNKSHVRKYYIVTSFLFTGFESRTSLNVFRLSFRNCKSCVYNCDDPLSYN